MRKIVLIMIVVCILAGCADISEPSGTESPSEPIHTEFPHQAVESENSTSESESESESEESTSQSEELSTELDDLNPEFVWKKALPEELGLNPQILTEASEYVRNDGRINSFLIVKDEYLILEEYYNGFDMNSLHNIYSCTKSVMSALIGIAISNNYIRSVDETVLDFFPDYEFRYTEEKKMRMTIKHLLTMTSGLKWGELSIPYTDWDNPFIQMINSEDWVKFVLDKPVLYEPGTVFDYNTGNSHVLSALLQRATKMDTLSYAHQYLFGPLGISQDDIFWEQDPRGIYVGGAWLHMRSRDMAKFGLLYLKRGEWNGNQIVLNTWVVQSTTSHVSIEEYADYGYHWWVDDTMYFAEGYKGQFICVLEDVNIVLVLTADIPDSDVSEVFKTIIAYIRSA